MCESKDSEPQICSNCTFSDPYRSDNLNFCRRHAPQCGLVDTQPAIPDDAVWPLVKDNDWCGEFEAE